MRALLKVIFLSLLFTALIIISIITPNIGDLSKANAGQVKSTHEVKVASSVTTANGVLWVPIFGLPTGSDQMYYTPDSVEIKTIGDTRLVVVKLLDPNPDLSKHESTGYIMNFNCHKHTGVWARRFTFDVSFPDVHDQPLTGEDNDPKDPKDLMGFDYHAAFYQIFCADSI